MSENYDIVVVGAGMAGASLAAELAQHGAGRILVVEAEDQPGYHATGRSAAFWEECYGGPELVPLTLGSGKYLRENGFLEQRGALYIGRSEDAPLLDGFMGRFSGTGATIERISGTEILRHMSGLRPEWSEGVWEPACADIDVAGLHQHYLRQLKQHDVTLRCRARVEDIARDGVGWSLTLADGSTVNCKLLANAAGAWADELAGRAGVKPVGITPLRRTVAQLRTNPEPECRQPLTLDIKGRFYFKSEGQRVWLSPHDETPSAPCDAAPEEIDVAEAIDRFVNVSTWQVENVERKWAGLRSFSPDRLPVYGFDPLVPTFFWFAGQGGYGIQTAPAAARLAAQIMLGLEPDAMTEAIDAALYSPLRFAVT